MKILPQIVLYYFKAKGVILHPLKIVLWKVKCAFRVIFICRPNSKIITLPPWIKSKISYFFEKFTAHYLKFSALHSADKLSNEQQIFGLPARNAYFTISIYILFKVKKKFPLSQIFLLPLCKITVWPDLYSYLKFYLCKIVMLYS